MTRYKISTIVTFKGIQWKNIYRYRLSNVVKKKKIYKNNNVNM